MLDKVLVFVLDRGQVNQALWEVWVIMLGLWKIVED